MTARERFLAVLNGKEKITCGNLDRLPMIEWAPWWGETMSRWENEGFPKRLGYEQSLQYFGLDELHCLYCAPHTPKALSHGAAVMNNEEDYECLKKDMYPDWAVEQLLDSAKNIKSRHDNGEVIIRVWLDGFFWFPRKLFGIEPHLFAFYDYPELMSRITRDLRDFNMLALTELFKIMKPDFIGYGEDMSYNHGPMLSKECFDKFMMPHYRVLNDFTHANKVKALVDSDGDITVMIPWFLQAGIDGVYPLERQANVDIAKIRADYPEFIMLGGYDKMIMNKGETAIRAEFERILPVMKSGYYIPSVDHQTPPGVSLDEYKIYIKIFEEYCKKALN